MRGSPAVICTQFVWMCEDSCRVFCCFQIDLSNNQLAGPLPTDIGNLAKLQSLSLSINLLTGGLPSTIGQLAALTSLLINANQFSLPLPSTVGLLTALRTFDCSVNYMVGCIPLEMGNMTSLELMTMWGNRFDCGLPPSFGKLVKVQKLYLQLNRIKNVPTDIGLLKALTVLDISRVWGRDSGFGGSPFWMWIHVRLRPSHQRWCMPSGNEITAVLPSEACLCFRLCVCVCASTKRRWRGQGCPMCV